MKTAVVELLRDRCLKISSFHTEKMRSLQGVNGVGNWVQPRLLRTLLEASIELCLCS